MRRLTGELAFRRAVTTAAGLARPLVLCPADETVLRGNTSFVPTPMFGGEPGKGQKGQSRSRLYSRGPCILGLVSQRRLPAGILGQKIDLLLIDMMLL